MKKSQALRDQARYLLGMMAFCDDAFLAKMREYADRARLLFSNPQKPERERMIVRAFLRCIGEAFGDGKIIASSEEPIDLRFRSAGFQIMEIVGNMDVDWRGVSVRTDIAMHDVSQMYWSRKGGRTETKGYRYLGKRGCLDCAPKPRAWPRFQDD